MIIKPNIITQEEYKKQLNDAKLNYEEATKAIHIKRAQSLIRFGVGDIIESGSIKLQISRITTYIESQDAMPVYRGYALNKDLSPKKKPSIECIFDNREIKLIKKNEI